MFYLLLLHTWDSIVKFKNSNWQIACFIESRVRSVIEKVLWRSQLVVDWLLVDRVSDPAQFMIAA